VGSRQAEVSILPNTYESSLRQAKKLIRPATRVGGDGFAAGRRAMYGRRTAGVS